MYLPTYNVYCKDVAKSVHYTAQRLLVAGSNAANSELEHSESQLHATIGVLQTARLLFPQVFGVSTLSRREQQAITSRIATFEGRLCFAGRGGRVSFRKRFHRKICGGGDSKWCTRETY